MAPSTRRTKRHREDEDEGEDPSTQSPLRPPPKRTAIFSSSSNSRPNRVKGKENENLPVPDPSPSASSIVSAPNLFRQQDECVTPTKQVRRVDLVTPNTTPRATRYKSDTLVIRSPTKTKTTASPSKPPTNVYAHARQLLRVSSIYERSRSFSSSKSELLEGRTKERQVLWSFVANRFPKLDLGASLPDLKLDRGGDLVSALYISGRPGVGKTALAHELLSVLEGKEGIRTGIVNCMSLSSETVWQKMLGFAQQDGDGVEEQVNKKSSLFALSSRETFTRLVSSSKGDRLLIVLDELDSLSDRPSKPGSPSPLAPLFSLCSKPNSRLTVIGIANALTFAQQGSLFPSTSTSDVEKEKGKGHRDGDGAGDGNGDEDGKKKSGLATLACEPYSDLQMMGIVRKRLSRLLDSYPNGTPSNSNLSATSSTTNYLIQAPALKLVAKRVAKETGDARKCLDVVRKAIELVETEQLIKHNEPNDRNDEDGGASSSLALDPTPETTPTKSKSHKRSRSLYDLSTPSGGIPSSDPLGHFTPLTAPQVGMAHAQKALQSSTMSAHVEPVVTLARQLDTISLQARCALVGILIAIKRSSSLNGGNITGAGQSIEARHAYSTYRDLVGKAGGVGGMVGAVQRNEFDDLVMTCDAFVSTSTPGSSSSRPSSPTKSASSSSSRTINLINEPGRSGSPTKNKRPTTGTLLKKSSSVASMEPVLTMVHEIGLLEEAMRRTPEEGMKNKEAYGIVMGMLKYESKRDGSRLKM